MMQVRKAILLALVLTLAGCSNPGDDELSQWMAEQKRQTQPKITPISAPKQFKPENYTQTSEFEPFSSQKLTQALKRESNQSASSGALVAPELARRKEALEAFPLDTMSMVGLMSKGGQPVALVKAGNLLYQVRQGGYLGQNFGRVTKISETDITLREIVQDAVGEWIERTATLQLQERSK